MAVPVIRELTAPFTADKVRELRVRDLVRLTGRIHTGRDRLHKFLFEGGESPVELRDGAIYHCGPVVLRRDSHWVIQASGPTTSAREESYMPALIAKFGLRLIIGKGGMGPETVRACSRFGCVYLEAVGGAAQVLNEHVTQVVDVRFFREFGSTEAMWELDVKDFPAIVSIDTRGNSLHRRVQAASRRMLARILRDAPPFGG